MNTSSAFCGRSTLTVPITRRAGGDAELRPHVGAVGGGGGAIPFGTCSIFSAFTPSISIILRWSSRETAMKTVLPRPITSRSTNRRIGRPSKDQVCSCATITGTRARRPITRAPDVRAELVRVHHVDALAAQQPVERQPVV